MRNFFTAHPYLRIFLIVILYSTILFCWGKVFRDVEWYLDQVSMWIAIVASIIGLGFTSLLLYFRYQPETPNNEKLGHNSVHAFTDISERY